MFKYVSKNLLLLLIYFISSLAGYLIISATNHLYYNQLYGNDNFKYLASPLTIFIYLFLTIFFLTLVFKLSEQVFQRYFKIIIISCSLIIVVLLFVPPVTSSDAWQYVLQAKIFNFYQANPYITLPAQFPDDPLTPNVSDPLMAVVYGPVFTGLNIILNILSNNNIYLNLGLLKLANLLAYAGLGWLIAKLLQKYQPQFYYTGLFFWLANPLIFYEIFLNAHNDIIMMFFLFMAFYLLLNKKYFWAIPLAIIAILIKPTSLILLPLILLYLILKKYSAIKILWSSILASLICFVSWLPFYQGTATWSGWRKMAGQTNHFLLVTADKLSLPVAPIRIIMITIFLIYFLIILGLFIRQQQRFLDNINLCKPIVIILLAYILLASFWLQPWYLLILLPFLVFYLQEKRLLLLYYAFYFLILTYGFLLDNLLL